MHSVRGAPLPPDELVRAQLRAEEQVPPLRPPGWRGAPLPEEPRKRVAQQAEAELPERARQVLLPPPVAQARRRASVWPSAQTWRLRPPPLHRRVP